MSKWTHNICLECWGERCPDGRKPVRLVNAGKDRCCFCGEPNKDGIYIREDPTKLMCQGEHDE